MDLSAHILSLERLSSNGGGITICLQDFVISVLVTVYF